MSKFIPLSVPNLCGNEAAYCQKAIASEWVSTGGAYITEFEEKIAAYVGTPGAVACQSGTAGLHLALLSCGVGQNDEVLVPTLTFIAAVNPVKYVGAEPVFMDCDDTLCMDMQKVERFCETECAMTPEGLLDKATGRYVRAMLVVHVFGNLADLDKAAALAEKYDLALIEDATEALGSRYLSGRFAGRFAGTVGKVGVYSFNGNKIITTGGGGMLVSGDEAILREAKYLSTQAKDDTLYFVHNHIGYNSAGKAGGFYPRQGGKLPGVFRKRHRAFAVPGRRPHEPLVLQLHDGPPRRAYPRAIRALHSVAPGLAPHSRPAALPKQPRI